MMSGPCSSAAIFSFSHRQQAGLRHGRFTSLEAKLAQAKAWPTILERFGEAGFRQAVEEAEDAGRLRRFREASPTHPLLDAIVVPYLEAPHLTFSYARDRLAEAYGAGIGEKPFR